EPVQLVHQGIEGVLEFEDVALDVDSDLPRQVAARDGGSDLRDAAHLVGEVRRHDVYVVGQVLPGSGDAGHGGLPPELAFGADFAGDARHFGSEGTQLVDHRVDGVLQLQHLAADVHGDLSRQVAVRDSDGHLGNVAHLRGEVVSHRIDVVGQVLPDARHVADIGLAPEGSLGADLARPSRHFECEHPHLLDHAIDDLRGTKELAFDAMPVDLERNRFREVAMGYGGDAAGYGSGRPEQIIHQAVYGGLHSAPRTDAAYTTHARTLPAAATDCFTAHLLYRGQVIVCCYDVVERIRDLARETCPVAGQPH